MNSKRANRLFLSVILLHFVLVGVLVVGSQFFSLGIFENLLVSQMIILIPALVSLFGKKEKITAKELGFRKIKISTVFLVVLYTLLCMPLVTVVNAISMLFVENTVVSMSDEVLEMPFLMMFLMMAVLGPFSEEFVFRGVVFNSYRKDGNTIGAILLSALVFSFMHMNFNQAGYAFVIGVALAFAMVATRSILAPMIMHFMINAQSVVLMYLTEHLLPGGYQEEAAAVTQNALLVTIGIYSVIAAVTTTLAVCLLIYISDREGGKEDLQNLFRKPELSGKRITPSLMAALLITLGYMILEAVLAASTTVLK